MASFSVAARAYWVGRRQLRRAEEDTIYIIYIYTTYGEFQENLCKEVNKGPHLCVDFYLQKKHKKGQPIHSSFLEGCAGDGAGAVGPSGRRDEGRWRSRRKMYLVYRL